MSWNHIRDEKPKARKDHTCYLCELRIPKGTVHVCRTGSFDGELVTQRMHKQCEFATQDWDDEWENTDPVEFRGCDLSDVALAEIKHAARKV